MDTRTTTAHDLARRGLLMQRWDDDEAAAIIHPDAGNEEAVSEPPAARGRGPAAFKATHDWLQATFEGLRWDVEELVAEGDLVVARTVMRGRQVAPFATFGPDGGWPRCSPPAAGPSPPPRPTGSGWPTAASSGTRPTATTSARPASSAGSRRARPSWSARPWPGGACVAPSPERSTRVS